MIRTKSMLFLIVALLILTLVPSSPPASLVHKVHATTRSITLYAALSGWNYTKTSGSNPTIVVTKGDTVSFNLIGEDTLAHFLLIDFDGNGVMNDCSGGQDKCSGNIPATGTGSIAPFVVTANPGNYFYYCLYHSPAYMVGTLMVQDYTVSASLSAVNVLPGTNANSTVSVTSQNNFAGSVSLSATPPSSWPLPVFTVNPVSVSAGSTAMSNLTIFVPSGTSPGQYIVAVTASYSMTSHSTNIVVTVPTPSFSVSGSPASLTISSGSTGTSTISILGSNGFSGMVNLAATVPPGLATVALSPASVPLSPSATSATSMLTVSSALGKFNVTVTASNGSTSHSTQVLVNGADFSIMTSTGILSTNQGSSANLVVTISSTNGLSGSITLSASLSPSGPSPTFSPTTVQVPSGGSAVSTLTVSAATSGTYPTPVATGSYTITVNATMGALSHVTTIPLTVTSSSGASILTNPVVIGGIVAAVVIAGVVVYALTRRPKK